MSIDENLNKASDSAAFLRGDLMEANKTASAVESLLICELIGKAAELQNRIKALADARGAK